MTTEEIKRIVDDERAEQLTAQLCHHWKVATERLDDLAQELTTDMNTCIEAEIYAAIMRMQNAVMALMELNMIPTAYLFSEYLDRIGNTVADNRIRKSVMTLMERLIGEKPKKQQGAFFDLVTKSIAHHFAMPQHKQEAIVQKADPLQYMFSVCAQYLNPDDLMKLISVVQNIKTEGDMMNQEETNDFLKKLRQTMETIDGQMNESLQMMLIWLFILMMLPGLLVSLMKQSRSNSKAMAQLFKDVLWRVRESNTWWNYWKEHRDTLRVINDCSSWKDIMTVERTKELSELGQVSGGLFAKWTNDYEVFEEEFLNAGLDDEALRHFIFHLAALYEITREIDPTTRYGYEQLINDELQKVGEAVLSAAGKLQDLVDNAWFPHYEAMWKDLVQSEIIFAHLRVTRKSPHNNLFTSRFFCHLVGEMKKRAVFGGHSDMDLAKKIAETQFVDTFRKNIQEGMSDEDSFTKSEFDTIYLKYNNLAHPKQ